MAKTLSPKKKQARKDKENSMNYGEKKERCPECRGEVTTRFDPQLNTHTGTCRKCKKFGVYPRE